VCSDDSQAYDDDPLNDLGADNMFQTDIALLFLLTFMIQLPSVQKMVSCKIPSMYNLELNQLSIVGVSFNAAFVVVFWIICRKVAYKYLKAV